MRPSSGNRDGADLVANHVESLRLQNFNVKEIYMQKKLIALAIAGLSGAAFAQSNVQIYGVGDVSYDFVSGGGGTNTAAGNAITSSASKGRIGTNSSYFGLKGSESLGSGLTAVYQIENEFDFGQGANNGSQGTLPGVGNSRPNGLANRDSFVGLAGAFGTVAAGWLSSPHRSLAAKFDLAPGAGGPGSSLNIIGRINAGSVLNPLNNGQNNGHRFGNATFTPTTITSNALGAGGTYQSTVSGTAETVANNVGIIGRHAAVAYITPNFNGFVGTIAYVANEVKDNAQLGSSTANTGTYAQRNPRAWNVKFDYDNGPLSLGYSYLKINDFGVLGGLTATAAAAGINGAANGNGGGLVQLGLSGKESTTAHLLGAKYTFAGTTTVSFMYDRTQTDLEDGPAAGDGKIGIKRANWYLAAKHSIGAHDISAAYAKAGKNKVSLGTALAAGNDAEGGSDASQWTLRYAYNFSKRTSAYAQYATIRNGSNASYDFTASTAVMGTGNGTVTAGADPTVYSFGIRHNF